MLFKRALLPMVILASLTGCGPAALDGSTSDTLDASISKVASKLPDAQRAQFGEDITLIRSYYEKQNPNQLLPNLNGKNVADITAEAGNLREQQRLEQEKLAVEEQQRAYLADLKQKKTALEEAIKPLQDSRNQAIEYSKFEILSGKLGQLQNKKTGDLVNGIELNLKNGTSQEIYTALFSGSLSVTGADKPVLASGFDVEFDTPIQPGETRTVLFVPPMVSDWRSVAIPEHGAFTIQLNELLNIANKPLFSQSNFTLLDQESLDKMLADLKAVDSELGVASGGDTVVPATAASAPAESPAAAYQSQASTALLPEQAEDTDDSAEHALESATPSPLLPTPEPTADPVDLGAVVPDPAVTGQDPVVPADAETTPTLDEGDDIIDQDEVESGEPAEIPSDDAPSLVEQPKSLAAQTPASDGGVPFVGKP